MCFQNAPELKWQWTWNRPLWTQPIKYESYGNHKPKTCNRYTKIRKINAKKPLMASVYKKREQERNKELQTANRKQLIKW